MKFRTTVILMVSLALFFSCKKKGEEKKGSDKPVAENSGMKHGMKRGMKGEMKMAMKVEKPVEKPVEVVEKPKKPDTPAEAVAIELTGKVEVKRAEADDFVMVTTNMPLYVGDQVRVDAENASAKLRLWDESTVVLGPGAEAVINAGADLANGSPSITMLTGTSNLMIEPREEDQSVFTVYTPSAVLSVLGTEFDVGIADSGSVKVGVEEGIVEIADQEGNKALELTKGKQVVVAVDGKASAPKAYNAEKEDWNKWYDSETKVATDNVDTLTKSAVDRLEDLKKKIADLEAGIAKMETKSAELAKKAETAAAKSDAKAYAVESKPLVDTMTEAETAAKRNRKLEAMMAANAYLVRRLNAMVKAGIIKPKEAKRKLMLSYTVKVDPWLDDLQVRRIRQARIRRARERRWRRLYLRHHPRGRNYAKRTKMRLPKFYSSMPTKKWKPRRRFKPTYLTGVKYRPRPRFKGKKRVLKAHFSRNRAWYKARKSPRMNDKKRQMKMMRLRKRLKRMKRRRVVVRRVNKPIRRRRVIRRHRLPMGPRGMMPRDPRIMGPRGKVILPHGRVPRGPHAMGMGLLRPGLMGKRPMVRGMRKVPPHVRKQLLKRKMRNRRRGMK